MSLVAGVRLGPYEIVAPLGAGGMGEVYRARDTRLKRDVALKVLPEDFAADPDRLARFQREAEVLAALNHPHIAHIHGFEEAAGVRALVLELVEGPTLADRLAQGAISIAETLAVARQIAEALDAAHERGIIHRDLKPANIKVRADGTVKVLDFGLAKAMDPTSGEGARHASPRQDSPTITSPAMTLQGMVLGTAAYMSPEQARGHAIDKRTDIWAFGCVVYEMLTTRAPFQGGTLSDSIAKVLTAEPDWGALPSDTPPGVVRLLKRCLERDPKRRLRDLGDLELALEVTPSPGAARVTGAWPIWIATVAGTILLTMVGTLAIARLLEKRPAAAALVRFEESVSETLSDPGAFSVSPDGRRVVFGGTGVDGRLRLWARSLDTLETRPLSGTEGEVAFNTPPVVWSPDGRFIAFYAEGRIKKLDSTGGVAQEICQVPGVAVGGSWNRDDVIVLGNTAGGLLQCPSSGGAPAPVTASSDSNTFHLFPSFLPDGQRLLYLRVSRSNPAENGIYIADLKRPANEQSTERLLETGFGAEYVTSPDGPGQILFVRDKTLWAVAFDASQVALSGEPVRIAEPVGSFRDGAFFSAASDLLVYRGDPPNVQLEWRDRKGARLRVVGEPGPYVGLAMSPDATRAVVLRENRLNRADQDLWIVDLERDTTTRFTSDPLLESIPAWSADGTNLMFALGSGGGDIWVKPMSGASGTRLLAQSAHTDFRVNPLLTSMSTTSDGRFLVFMVEAATRTRNDLWILPLGENSLAAPLLQQEFDQSHGSVSPDGRWLAYVSNESGVNEVFVRPFTSDSRSGTATTGAAALISRGGGVAPRWRRDSAELFYQSSAGHAMAVRVASDRFEKPIELFRAQGMLTQWGVTPDGQRFLVALPVRQGASAPFNVVLNWQAALRR